MYLDLDILYAKQCPVPVVFAWRAQAVPPWRHLVPEGTMFRCHGRCVASVGSLLGQQLRCSRFCRVVVLSELTRSNPCRVRALRRVQLLLNLGVEI